MASSMPDPRGNRRPWRPVMSVRFALALVLALGLVLGWFAERAHSQRRAVAAIREVGGQIYYDYLEGLVLSETAIGDAGLECLKGLGRLQILGVDETRVSPAGKAELRKAIPALSFDEIE